MRALNDAMFSSPTVSGRIANFCDRNLNGTPYGPLRRYPRYWTADASERFARASLFVDTIIAYMPTSSLDASSSAAPNEAM